MNGPRQYRALFAIQDLPELATLKDVIEKRYDDLLFEYLCDQIRLNPKKIGRRTRAGTVPDIALLRDFEVVRVDILGRDCDSFFLDVIVATDIEITETRRPGPDSDMVSQWFRVRCDLTMAYEEQGFAMHSIGIYRAAKKPSTLSPYLIPYIGKNDLDAVAEDFLARFYPEALESPCPVPSRVVAERMGLKVKIVPLSEDLSLFGQVLFADGTLQISDYMAGTTKEIQVAAGTILMDQTAYHRLRPASINSTILHECVHWDKDRSFFYLQRQFNEEVSAYAFWKPKLTPSAGKWTPLDWMEWQTKDLTPRILMPAAQARRKADEILAKYNGRMVSVISEMAEFFQVTWQMAKQRLVELGYQEAGEVLPIAGRKATKWLFAPSEENSQRTYEISTQAALREYINNPDFRAEIDTGHFQYVEGRFCVSHERYICPSESGGVRLTEYAKTHLDECCLAFRMPIWSNNDTEALKRNTLYRSAGFGATYEGSGMSVAQTAEELGARATKITGILKKLPAGFGETLNAHMQRLGISGEQLAEKTLVSPKIIQRMINDEKYSGKAYASDGIDPWLDRMGAVIKHLTRYADIICWQTADLMKTGSQFIEPTGFHSIRLFADANYRPLWIRIWKMTGNLPTMSALQSSSNKPAPQYDYVTTFAGQETDAYNDQEYSWVSAFASHAFQFVRRLTRDERRKWGYAGVWEIPAIRRDKDSEPQIPVELPWRCLKMHSDVNGAILDPFAGLGTTIIAAEQSSRVCRAIEEDPMRCDLIVRRWEQFTGEKAEQIQA